MKNIQKYLLALLFLITLGVSTPIENIYAQVPTPAQMGIVGNSPNVIQVYDTGGAWSSIGTVNPLTHVFTPASGGGGAGIGVGSSPVTGGTNGCTLFNNAGLVGCGAGGSNLTVGTSPIISGSNGCLLYDNLGVLGCEFVISAASIGQLTFYNGTTTVAGFTLGGDCTLSQPNITCTKVNGKALTLSAALTTTGGASETLAFPGVSFVYTYPSVSDTLVSLIATQTLTNKTLTSPTITSPIVTGSFTATGLVTNADLANSSTTVNGTLCTLGGTCTIISGITVGSTGIGGATNGYYLYNNAGILGNLQPNAANGPLQLNSSGQIPITAQLGNVSGTAACTGCIGEQLVQDVTLPSAVSFTSSGTVYNVASRTISAGSWQCNANVQTSPAASTISFDTAAWISTVSATEPAASEGVTNVSSGEAEIYPATSSNSNVGIVTPIVYYNFSAPTIVYLSGFALFSTSTMKAYGRLECVRIR